MAIKEGICALNYAIVFHYATHLPPVDSSQPSPPGHPRPPRTLQHTNSELMPMKPTRARERVESELRDRVGGIVQQRGVCPTFCADHHSTTTGARHSPRPSEVLSMLQHGFFSSSLGYTVHALQLATRLSLNLQLPPRSFYLSVCLHRDSLAHE